MSESYERPTRKMWLFQDAYMDKVVRGFKIDVAGITKTPLPYGERVPYEGVNGPTPTHLRQKGRVYHLILYHNKAG